MNTKCLNTQLSPSTLHLAEAQWGFFKKQPPNTSPTGAALEQPCIPSLPGRYQHVCREALRIVR